MKWWQYDGHSAHSDVSDELSFIRMLKVWSVHRRPLVVACLHGQGPAACFLH